MSTSPVTLDFSKATPLPANGPAQPPVTLDFSKATPLTPDNEASMVSAGPAAAHSVMANTPMQKNNTALAVGNTPGGSDPHNPGNANMNAIPAESRDDVNDKLTTTAMLTTPMQGLGAMADAPAAMEGLGKVRGLTKAAWDWASANPVKTYMLWKIAEEAGLKGNGIKKVFHLVSGSDAE